MALSYVVNVIYIGLIIIIIIKYPSEASEHYNYNTVSRMLVGIIILYYCLISSLKTLYLISYITFLLYVL